MLQRHHHTKGLILKKQCWNEADYSVTFYSPELGKIRAIAKGARKMTSSMTGHLETLNICNFQLYQSIKGFSILQCQTVKNFKEIRKDLDRSMLAILLLEIFEKSTLSEEVTDEQGYKLFDLIEKTLEQLNQSEPFSLEGKTSSPDSQKFLIMEGFKLKLLDFLGVLPNMSACFSCHKRWNETVEIWMATDGHISCEICKDIKNITLQKIPFKIIKLMHFLLSGKTMNKKIVVSRTEQNELKKITYLFLSHSINHEILSEKIFNQLQKLSAERPAY